MKVTSSTTIEFPSLGFALHAGEEAELPIDKEAQEIILSHPQIFKVEVIKKENIDTVDIKK